MKLGSENLNQIGIKNMSFIIIDFKQYFSINF
jgi:hypothetical protein